MAGRKLFADTNLLLRHLVQNHESQGAQASDLIAASDRGEVSIIVLPVVLAECVYVLESHYKLGHAKVAEVLTVLLGSPGFKITDLTIYIDALDRYGEGKAHFVDCVLAAHGAARQVPVATFGAGFKRFSDVRVELE